MQEIVNKKRKWDQEIEDNHIHIPMEVIELIVAKSHTKLLRSFRLVSKQLLKFARKYIVFKLVDYQIIAAHLSDDKIALDWKIEKVAE